MSGENFIRFEFDGCGEKHMHLTDEDRRMAQKDFDEIVNDTHLSKSGQIGMLHEKIMQYNSECEKCAQNATRVSVLADKYHLIGESLKNLRLANALDGLRHRQGFVPHGSVSPAREFLNKKYRESPLYV